MVATAAALALVVTALAARAPVNSQLASTRKDAQTTHAQLAKVQADDTAKATALKAAQPPPPNYGQMYLDTINPTNVAEKTWYAIDAAVVTATPAAWQAIAAPYVSTIDVANQALLRITWPSAQITTDVKAVIQASSDVASDLTTANWSQLPVDEQKWHTASSAVRADLNLPPPS